MRTSIKRFYESEEAFQHFCCSLKQKCCPHCKRTGTLIRHGYLYGYSDTEQAGHPEGTEDHQILRGHRLFCSNRYRRPGCGKTWSVLRDTFLKGFVITAVTLWAFLSNVAAPMPKGVAFKRCKSALSGSGAYRFFRRVTHVQSRIRSFLLRHRSAPEVPDTTEPLKATIVHLQNTFPDSACPIAAFQGTFQTNFL